MSSTRAAPQTILGASKFFLVPMFLLVGCGGAHPPQRLPTYPWIDDQTALRILSERARGVKTVSAASLLTMTRPDGTSIRLDAAVVISVPDHSVRLRAWKFNQPVFDLTLTPRGLWIESTQHNPNASQQILPASVSASQLARALAVFEGEFFDGLGVRVVDHGGPQFQVQESLDGGQSMTADIDRATLIVSQYRLTDASGKIRFNLTPGQHEIVHGIVWPTRLIARGDGGTIDVELRDVELNGELNPAAFIPPKRAEKLP